MEEKDFRIVFAEVIKGYSFIKTSKENYYIKHFNILDVADVDEIYNSYLSKAQEIGVPSSKEREEYIIEEELWSKKEETEITQNKQIIQNLNINLEKEFLKSRRREIRKEIDEIQSKTNVLSNKKSNAIGNTAETYASKKSNEYYIKESFYKNKELTEIAFSEEKFEDLEEKEINYLAEIYNKEISKFKSANLKKLSLFPFFLNLLGLSEDVLGFYGKPIVSLTFYQSELYSFGRYFKNILSEQSDNIPKTILSNPDELIEWIEIKRNFNEFNKDKEDPESMSIIGAKKEDLEALGLSASVNTEFSKKLKENKKVTMDDIVAMSG